MGTAKGVTPRTQRRVCAWCGAEFMASRDDAKTCGARCRTALCRRGATRDRTKGELQEALHLAELERDLWEAAFRALASQYKPKDVP